MQIGVIGTGNMGTILIESLIGANKVPEENLVITNRTIEKALLLKEKYPKIHVLPSPEDVVKKTNVLLICIKPIDFHPLLEKIGPILEKGQCLVSISSPISAKQLESLLPCSCIRVIPSITNRAFSGVSLVTYGKNCAEDWKEKIKDLFASISTPIEIHDDITRVASDIVSCGPAFFSLILQKFIKASIRIAGIEPKLAERLATEMIIGFGKLLEKQIYSLETLERKVNVKGGITGEGLKVLEKSGIEETFQQLFQATHQKFREELETVKGLFDKK